MQKIEPRRDKHDNSSAPLIWIVLTELSPDAPGYVTKTSSSPEGTAGNRPRCHPRKTLANEGHGFGSRVVEALRLTA